MAGGSEEVLFGQKLAGLYHGTASRAVWGYGLAKPVSLGCGDREEPDFILSACPNPHGPEPAKREFGHFSPDKGELSEKTDTILIYRLRVV